MNVPPVPVTIVRETLKAMLEYCAKNNIPTQKMLDLLPYFDIILSHVFFCKTNEDLQKAFKEFFAHGIPGAINN